MADNSGGESFEQKEDSAVQLLKSLSKETTVEMGDEPQVTTVEMEDEPQVCMDAVSIPDTTKTAPEIQAMLDNMHMDPYSEDEAELRFLHSKPTCFIMFGKPGVGKTTLARRFAQEWKCELINSTDLIIQNMNLQTEVGKTCVEILARGEAIPEDLVFQMIMTKIHSPEVAHHGYILDDFPCMSEETLTIKDQLEVIKSWKLKPDFIINLKIPDADLHRRRANQKLDPVDGTVYTREVYAPDKPMKVTQEKGEGEEEDEEEDAEEEEEEEGGSELALEIVERLIRRPEDMTPQLEANLGGFKDKMLRMLEDYMADHNQQFLVEMDGNQNYNVLFKQLMQKLSCFLIRPAAVPVRLHDTEEEEIPEDVDTEELMRSLAPKQMVAPRFRWRRSRWLRFCPVALFDGAKVPGKPEFAVSFLDKMYCLEAEDAMDKFVKNPRPYLLPPQPRPPCKLSVLGPPLSGKSTLCSLLAQKYNAKVLKVEEIIKPRMAEEKQKMIEQVRAETTEAAIQSIKNKLREQAEAEAAAKEEAARLAAEQAAKEAEERLAAEAVNAQQAGEEGGEVKGEQIVEKEDADTKPLIEVEIEKEDANAQPSIEVEVEKEDANAQPLIEVDEEKEAADTKPSNEMEMETKEGEEAQEADGEKKEAPAEELPMEAAEDIVLPTEAAGEVAPEAAEGAELQVIVPPSEPEVDATHPEVVALVEAAVAEAEKQMVTLPPEIVVEVVEAAIKAKERSMRLERIDGPLHGGWILDNFPSTRDLWNACVDKNLLPDDVIVLTDNSENGVSLAKRFYTKNKDTIDAQIQNRLQMQAIERQRQEEEKRKQEEEEKKLAADEERRRRIESGEVIPEEEAVPGEADLESEKEVNEKEKDLKTSQEDDAKDPAQSITTEASSVQPDTQEVKDQLENEIPTHVISEETQDEGIIEDKEKNEVKVPECPEMDAFHQMRQEFDKEQANVLSAISGGTSLEPVTIDLESKPIEMVLEEVIVAVEKFLTYQGWEFGAPDAEEEDEDMEADAAEEEEEEEEEEEVEEEDPSRSRKKPLGETNWFCPVALKKTGVLFPGNSEIVARFREKVFYMSSTEARDEFLANPQSFLPKEKPLKAPPLRLLILGPRGAGKTLHGRHLSEKLGLFHISFKERLQELIIAKTKKKIGPEFEEDNEEEPEEVESDEEGEKKEGEEEKTETTPDTAAELTAVDSETNEEKEPEIEFTEEEEAIKASLENSESLSNETLDTIVPQWWNQEPFKSTGFVLEGFPRTTEEAKYLQEMGLFPDAAIVMAASETDVIGRLLPSKLDKWKVKRDKRLAKKAKKKEKAKKKRDAAMQKRREELLKEHEEAKAERAAEKAANKGNDSDEEEVEEEEEEEEEEEDDIEAILAEEFEEEEEEDEEEEELEEDAVERMRNELNDLYDDDTNKMESVEEALEEIMIPKIEVDAGRKPHIVRYILNKSLKKYVEHRQSIFERVYTISERLALRMIQCGYKQPSRFGRWCPVKLLEGDCIQPMSGPGFPTYPCIYRQHIYFLSSKQNCEAFVTDPLKYLKQPSPLPVVPVRLAVIGPPKSGKTTVAKRFEEEYGVVRLSIGEAMRKILTEQPHSELASNLNKVLLRGQTVPEELQVQALETIMLDMQVQTRGYVLDGFPITKRQMELMHARSIIPVRVICLELDSKEVVVRGLKDRLAPNRTMPLHDSPQIQQIKLAAFKQNLPPILEWYGTEHMNVVAVDGMQSKWWVWDQVLEVTHAAIKQIQTYLHRIEQGKAASVADMCIRPSEFKGRLGDYSEYCPVRLAQGELVDCSTIPDLKYAAEFRGHYYKMCGQQELDKFLAEPEKYVPPLAPCRLPPPELLPKQRTQEEVKAMREVELQGYCPVTFLDGKCRYEAIIPGDPDMIVEYKKKFYYMENKEKLLKFMSQPEKYCNLKLPHKLPPRKEPLPVTGLPMLGYMEQEVATALIAALTACGNFKPKYPFVSPARSALLYVAYHLKAFNPKSSDYVRKKYKQKLEKFEETCKLIRYLGDNMTVRYKDPTERPEDFDSKLEVFFALKGIEPTGTWIS